MPGIMAFQALASRTGTIVAEDRSRVVICTALGDEDLACELADPATAVVVYKGGRRLPELAGSAVAAGRAADAIAGELIGMPGERIGSLRELAAGGPASYLATVIIPATTPTGGAVATAADRSERHLDLLRRRRPGRTRPDHPARSEAPRWAEVVIWASSLVPEAVLQHCPRPSPSTTRPS